MTGKIIKGIGGLYFIETQNGIAVCKPRGIFRKDNKAPVIGDVCTVTKNDDEIGVIESIHERKNELLRPKVSNIDQIAVVCAADSINLTLLDKYLIILEEQNNESFSIFIIINKIDLTGTKALAKTAAIYENIGYPAVFSSTVADCGTLSLLPFLKGKTTAFAGPSGVGKSSIVNLLCKEQVMAVGELSKKTAKGKHTTRHAEMFKIDNDSSIIDTPGFASLEFMDSTRNNLKEYFKEFKNYADDCRFFDCKHINEPDCAVKENVGTRINALRYENYLNFCQKGKL